MERNLIRVGESGAPRADGEWAAEADFGEQATVLSVLTDDACRAILCAADVPRTANELAEACDLPISTVYRKLERISATPLLEESTRIRQYGKHPQEYRRCSDRIQLRLPPDHRIDVDITVHSAEEERK